MPGHLGRGTENLDFAPTSGIPSPKSEKSFSAPGVKRKDRAPTRPFHPGHSVFSIKNERRKKYFWRAESAQGA